MTTRTTEADYLRELIRHGETKETVDLWLWENPPPPGWSGGRYAWAHLEMPVGFLARLLRSIFRRA